MILFFLNEKNTHSHCFKYTIAGLRLEARQKLAGIRPRSLGQAGRVSGVSPADVAVLMVYLKQREL